MSMLCLRKTKSEPNVLGVPMFIGSGVGHVTYLADISWRIRVISQLLQEAGALSDGVSFMKSNKLRKL